MAESHTNVLVRMTNELKAQLLREAAIQDSSLTAEINERLRKSFEPPASLVRQKAGEPVRAVPAKEPARDFRYTELEESILRVIRKMPPEKQLAFLSLFKE